MYNDNDDKEILDKAFFRPGRLQRWWISKILKDLEYIFDQTSVIVVYFRIRALYEAFLNTTDNPRSI
jgi:hypothetical protein